MGSTIASPVGASTPAAAAGIQGHFRLQRPGSSPSEREGFTLDVHFDLPGTGVSGIFGPSGSGKTTLLRCIAGLENAPGAHLQVNGQVWQDGKRSLPPHRRPLGFVFQQPSLFPHLNVQENLNFARRRANSATSASEYAEVLELMGIHHLLQRQPQQLSGGEQQRVAIARALLIRPSLLLMDEPMASLDVARKQEVLPYLQAMATTLELPILYVSHAVDEVARLTDQLLILEHGRVARAGKTTELMSRADFPAATADEIGVLLPATIQHRDSNWQLARADIPGGAIWIRDQGEVIGSPIRLRIQARDVSITRGATDQSSMLNRLPVTVGEIRPDRDPAMALVQLITGGDRSQACTLLARITQRSLYQLQLTTGESVWAQIKSVAIAR